MPSYVLSDGTNVVSLEPHYDILLSGEKIESSHRTLAGRNYRYTWGEYSRTKFNVDFLTSADMTRINSWWSANTPLVLYDMNSTVISSSYIVNPTKPIDGLVPPYTDMFRGMIQLEGY
jgi:hypothetical protein